MLVSALALPLLVSHANVRTVATTKMLAVYAGRAHGVCRGLTTRCPDHCGVTGDYDVYFVLRCASREVVPEMREELGAQPEQVAIQNSARPLFKPGDFVSISSSTEEVRENGSISYRHPHKVVRITPSEARKWKAQAPLAKDRFVAYTSDWETAPTLRLDIASLKSQPFVKGRP